MQQDGKQRVVSLGFNQSCAGGRQQCEEKIEDAAPILRQNLELEDGWLSLPSSTHSNGAVANHDVIDEQQIGLRPSFTGVQGIMDNLTIHLSAVKIAPRQSVLNGSGPGGKCHALLQMPKVFLSTSAKHARGFLGTTDFTCRGCGQQTSERIICASNRP